VRPINFSPGSKDLLRYGAIIRLTIGYPEAEYEEAVADGLKIPLPHEIHGLIDTGAAVTIVNPQLARSLKLPLIGEVSIQAAGHTGKYPEYLASVSFRQSGLERFTYLRVVACPILSKEMSCLIGRDILQHWELRYNGPLGQFSIQDLRS